MPPQTAAHAQRARGLGCSDESPTDESPADEKPAPPWRLLSSHCVVFTVRDERALEALAHEHGVKPSNLKQLVGLHPNLSKGLPQHKAGWQLVERAWWIARSAWKSLPAVAPMPFASADGAAWVDFFADLHGDVELDGARLRTLAHKGTYSAGSARVDCYRGWRNVMPSLVDIDNLPHVQPPSRFAQVRELCVDGSLYACIATSMRMQLLPRLHSPALPG